MSPQTRESIEKAAYTAVGAPVAAVKALNARLADLRETLKESRTELSEDLAKEFDVWVAEGERVVNKALERIRKSGTVEQARTASEKMRERVASTVEEMRAEMDEPLDIVEPEESLETIKGIGPGYSDRLNDAGIAGIASFLAHTRTEGEIERLADETGFTTDQIAQWREQVDLTRINGVGESYLRLFHKVGIWTVEQFAKADASDLAEAMAEIDLPGLPEAPSESRLAGWIGGAKELSS